MSEKQLKHLIVSDIKRLAKELGRPPLREEYLVSGKFKKWQVRAQFGSYSHALVASGLAHQRTRTGRMPKKDREIERHEDLRRLTRKYDEQIAPYISDKIRKPRADVMTIVVGSDFHSVWMDPFCAHVFIDTCRRLQPDVIALAGDVFDFYAVSAYSKNPERRLKLQQEIDFTIKHLIAPLRSACPRAQIDLFLGNHEWRLFKYLAVQAEGLSSLRALEFHNLLEIEKYKVNLVARKSFLTAKKERDVENYKTYGGCFTITHGTSTGAQHAQAELKRYGTSGVSGHVHHHQVQTMRDLSGEKTWTSLGCMSRLESGEEYIPDLVRWSQGFLVAHVWPEKKQSVQTYVHIQDDMAHFAGKLYRKKK